MDSCLLSKLSLCWLGMLTDKQFWNELRFACLEYGIIIGSQLCTHLASAQKKMCSPLHLCVTLILGEGSWEEAVMYLDDHWRS